MTHQRILMLRLIREWFHRANHEKLGEEYKQLVAGRVWYLLDFSTVKPGDLFSATWIDEHYPDWHGLIQESYEKGQAVADTGLLLAQRVLVDAIENLSKEDRDKVRQEVEAGKPASPIVTAILVFARNTENMLREKKGNANWVNMARQDVAQTLAGNLDAKSRSTERLLSSFVELTGIEETLGQGESEPQDNNDPSREA